MRVDIDFAKKGTKDISSLSTHTHFSSKSSSKYHPPQKPILHSSFHYSLSNLIDYSFLNVSVTILIWSCIWLPPSLKLSLFKDVFSPLHLITELYNEKVSSMDVVAEMRCPFTLWPFPVLQRQPQAPNGITHAKAHTQNLGLILNLTVNSPEV